MILTYYHWQELKYRFFYYIQSTIILGVIIFSYKEKVYAGLADPIVKEGLYLFYTQLSEPLMAWIKLSSYLAILMNMPFLLYQIYAYLKSGLYEYEAKKVRSWCYVYIIILIIGINMMIKGMSKVIIPFFLEYQLDSLDYCGKISEYISMIGWLMLGLLVLPILMMITYEIQRKDAKIFERSRGYILLVIMIITSMLTPPDILSLLIVGIPIYIVLEITYIAVILGKVIEED